MNCECNNKSNRVKPGIKHVYGNVLRMAIPLTLRTLVKDGDEMVVTDTDFIPSSDHPVRVVFSKGKTNYPIIATMDGNVAIVEDKGKIPVGTYDISVECYDDLGNPYRFKQNAVLYVADTTAEAGIDEEIEYEAQTWYLNAAVFLATTQIGEIGDAIDAKLDDVFGNVAYDANAKEIRFYNKDNSRVLATIDSRPFIADGTVADVYIDVGRQVLVVVLNEDAGGTRFSVPLYLVFAEYYKKDEVDSLVSSTVEGLRFDFSQELPLVVPVTKNGSSYSSPVDFGSIENAIREDGRLVVACVNNDIFYQLLVADRAEIAFTRVVALDGYQELLIVDPHNVWSMEDVDLGTGGGGGYEPPAGGIPKTDLAPAVQASLAKADSALQPSDLEGYATTDDVDNAVATLVSSAPQTLDTLKELADALGDDPNFATTMATQLGNKVDKETGKGLSTNDYTTAEKTKLAGIAAGAEVNVQPNWKQTNTSADDYIKNKPTLATVATSGSYNDLSNKPTIPNIDDAKPLVVTITSSTSTSGDNTTYSLTNGTFNQMVAAYNAGKDIICYCSEMVYQLSYSDAPSTFYFTSFQGDDGSYSCFEIHGDNDIVRYNGIIPTTADSLDAVPTTRKINNKPLSTDITLTASDVGALPASTTIPTKTSDLTNDSGFIDKAMYYGTCDTAAATMPKVCTVETFPTTTSGNVTHAKEGTIIAVKFTNSDTNTTAAPELNVNGIGAKAIMYNNAIVTSTAKNTTLAGTAKMLAYYRYDPALDEGNGAWEFLAKSVDSNSTYSNASLGQGYGTQTNSAATTAITSSISSYALSSGGIVTIKFTYDVPANATLNINSKGAKAIYNQGAAITAGVIKAGDTATFVYSTYYHLIAVDSWQDKQDAISDLATIRSGAAAGASALQSYTETDPTVPAWAKQQTKPTYTAQEVGAIPTVISTTYANLVTTRTNSQLIAGAWYRITDYTCTTTQTNTQSAGHQFDILVQATSPNTLSEEAKAIRHEGDTYFADANLEAWKIWYCIDNDTQKFAWADTTNGKGVIYRMIDEWGNDCPYDFKNIQYKRDLTDGVLDTENGTTTWVYTFNLWHTAQELYFDASIIGNALKNDEGFVNGVYNNKMGIVNSYTPYYGSGSSKTNFVLPNNVFLTKGEDWDYYGCRDNTLGSDCFSNTFGDSCFANTFGNKCFSNAFGNNCCLNTFKDACYSNTFGNECSSLTFGDSCFANTFKDYCTYNTFGNGCYSNTFGNYCTYNTFGNNCQSNKFGDYCQSNKFGNDCSNTFGNNCSSNTFGNSCRNNTFLNNCSYNTFGDDCSANTFSKPYTQNVIVENGNKKITLTSTQTPTNSNPLRNITIAEGVNNTDTTKTISHNTLNDTLRTTYVATNSVEVQV